MKIRRVKSADKPEYPAFADYLLNRERYVKGLSMGAGALLASGAMALAGEAVKGQLPAAPREKPAIEEPIRIKGAMVKPAESPPQCAPPVVIEGDIVAPQPPEKPRIQGKPAVPQPVRPVKPRGDVPAPKPPDQPPKVLGMPPPPPPAGGIRPPEPPEPTGKNDPKPDDPKQGAAQPAERIAQPRIRGLVAAPNKPEDKPDDKPQVKVHMVAPQAPQIGGLMVAPEPPAPEK